jgi:hypothetical protein
MSDKEEELIDEAVVGTKVRTSGNGVQEIAGQLE